LSLGELGFLRVLAVWARISLVGEVPEEFVDCVSAAAWTAAGPGLT
jgi:hypothetical protein